MSHVYDWCCLTRTIAFGEQETLLAQSRVIKRIQKSSSIRMIWPHQKIYRVITEVLGRESGTKGPCSFSVILSFIPSVIGTPRVQLFWFIVDKKYWGAIFNCGSSFCDLGNVSLSSTCLPCLLLFIIIAVSSSDVSHSHPPCSQLYIFKRNGETLSWVTIHAMSHQTSRHNSHHQSYICK